MLLEPEQAALLHAAKTYVIQECGCFSASAASAPTEGDQTASSPASEMTYIVSSGALNSTHSHSQRLLLPSVGLDFWHQR